MGKLPHLVCKLYVYMPRVCSLRQTKMWKLLANPQEHFLSFPLPGLSMEDSSSHVPSAGSLRSSCPLLSTPALQLGWKRTKFLQVYLNYRYASTNHFGRPRREVWTVPGPQDYERGLIGSAPAKQHGGCPKPKVDWFVTRPTIGFMGAMP